MFDVTMGCFVCELIGLFLLNNLSEKYGKNKVGLYRDDGLALLRNAKMDGRLPGSDSGSDSGSDPTPDRIGSGRNLRFRCRIIRPYTTGRQRTAKVDLVTRVTT